MPNKHKMIKCLVCEKWMRKDNVQRHFNTHKDILDLPEEELKEELRIRHTEQQRREVKRQRIIEIATQEGLTIPTEIADEVSTEKLPIRQTKQQQCEVKRQRIMEIATQEGLTEIADDVSTENPLLDRETLCKEMEEENRLYNAKIELGRMISSIIDEKELVEQSLNKEKQEALHLYRRQQPQFSILNVELRPWQQDAMKYFESPTKRNIIWICGKNGSEGKTWFQNYVQTFYGYRRVCKLDLRIKHANICNVLKKQTLGTIDIFLFNDSRSVSGEDLNLYRILEDIKDGQATTSKYDNDNIRFKTPNTIMVFSNKHPDLKKLSKDRWILLHPNKGGLKVVCMDEL